MRPTKYRINLISSEIAALNKIVRCQTTPQNKAKRARIILLANEEGRTNKRIAEHLNIHLCDVTRWTKRWIDQIFDSVDSRLSDAPRAGTPVRITAEQWCQIIALSCETPETHGYPFTHWSHKELAAECVKQGIVEALSPSYLGVVLKKRLAASSESLLAQCKAR